jgi:hypothetical protein
VVKLGRPVSAYWERGSSLLFFRLHLERVNSVRPSGDHEQRKEENNRDGDIEGSSECDSSDSMACLKVQGRSRTRWSRDGSCEMDVKEVTRPAIPRPNIKMLEINKDAYR